MTSFIKKKRNESMKPLTEEEIQKKLYGECKTCKKGNGTDKIDYSSYFDSNEENKTEKEPKEIATQKDAMPSDPESEDLFSLSEKSKPLAVENKPVIKPIIDEKENEEPLEEIDNNDESLYESYEIDEELLRAPQEEETVKFTYTEPKKPDNKFSKILEKADEEKKDKVVVSPPQVKEPVVTDTVSQKKPAVATSKTQFTAEFAKDKLSSLKIDLGEFIEKAKKFPRHILIIGLCSLVFLIIVFNIASRFVAQRKNSSASRNVSVSDARSVMPRPVQVRASEPTADGVRVTALNTPRQSSSTASPQINETANSGTSTPVAAEVPHSVYTIQICVYEDSKRADALIARLKDKGFQAYRDKIVTRSGRNLYAVCIGSNATTDQAETAFKKFKTTSEFKEFPDSFVKWID